MSPTRTGHGFTYDDQLVLTSIGWRFAQRRVRIDWQAETALFRPMMTHTRSNLTLKFHYGI